MMSPFWRSARMLTSAAVIGCAAALMLSFFPAVAQDATPDVTGEPTADVTAPAGVTAEATVDATLEPAVQSTAEVTAEATARVFNAPTVVGSGIVAPVIEALASAAGTPFTVNVTGTTSGINALCGSGADAALANRTINPDEESFCLANQVTFVEVLFGHNIAAVIAHPDADFAECLPVAILPLLFAPSASITNWTEISADNEAVPFALALPPLDSPAYAAVDTLIEGDGLRSDSTPLADESAVIAAVSADRGRLGVVSLNSATAAGDAVKLVELDFGEAGCSLPSAATVEGRTYQASTPLLAYINAGAIGDLLPLIDQSFADTTPISAAGFVPVSDAFIEEQRTALANTETGRIFSRMLTTFEINPAVDGEVTIGGAANEFEFLNNLGTAFTSQYAAVTTTVTVEGVVAGARRFCNGELDIIATFAPLTAEQETNCAANNITPYPVALGNQAVVLIGNVNTPFLECLTTAQLAAAMRASANGTVTTWNQVDPAFPETLITIFSPLEGDIYRNLLLLRVIGGNDPGRADMELYEDPLYRGAATANVEGSIGILSWTEWQPIAESDQVGVRLVSIDAGSGCVAPSDATIADGTYPLTRPLTLLVNRASFAKPQVQSLLWFLLSDTNYISLQTAGLYGLDFASLPRLRADLQQTYTAVTLEVSQAALSTAEPTAEATSEATAEATAAGS